MQMTDAQHMVLLDRLAAEIAHMRGSLANRRPMRKAADGDNLQPVAPSFSGNGAGTTSSGDAPDPNHENPSGWNGPITGFTGNNLGGQFTPNFVPQSDFNATNLGNTGNQNGGLSLTDYQGAINQSQANFGQTNANQNQLVGQLQDQAAGRGPATELANQQMLQALQQNQGAAAGTIASQRGIDPALAYRLAANTQAGQSQQEAGQAAQERLQSQLGATQALGGVLGQQQTGNLGLLGAGEAGQNSQNAALINQNLSTQGLNQSTATNNANRVQEAVNSKLNVATAQGVQNNNIVGATVGAGGTLGGGLVSGASNGYAPRRAADGGDQPGPSDQEVAEGEKVGGSVLSAIAAYALPALLAAKDGYDPEVAACMAANGMRIPSGHGPFPGDDKRNDTEPILVQKGEKVLPASIADDPKAAEEFVAALNQHHGIKPDMAAALDELALLGAKVSALEKKFGVKPKRGKVAA